MKIPKEIGEFSAANDELYLPFAAAIERGIVNPESVQPYSPFEAKQLLNAGKMPDKGGIIELGNITAAYDLVAANIDDDELYVQPSPKSAVDSETDEIKKPGLITLTFPNGLLRVTGIVVDTQQDPWIAHKLSFGRPMYEMGRILVSSIAPIEFEDFEVKDVRADGLVRAKPRLKIY